jgi:hypothetical protein
LCYCGRWQEATAPCLAGWIAKQMPIEHDAEMQHYLAGFRRAGLV